MAKANKKLDALHVALIDYLLARIEGTKVLVEGKMVVVPLPASELAVMAKLLKDNGIAADKDHSDDLQRLQEQLDSEKSAAGRNSILQSAVTAIAEESGIMH